MLFRILIGILFLVEAITGRIIISKSNDFKFVSDSPLDTYEKAAVVTNGPECAQIGSDILEFKNGSAVDAAIAALLCEGVASLHSMGLGGGFMMTIYDAPSGEASFFNARETAPSRANWTMYGGNAKISYIGGLSVAVPGELSGYWEAHQEYGRVPWKELFEPTIKLCKTGSIITKYLENWINEYEKEVRSEPTLSEILVNPETNQLYGQGDRIKRPRLAKFLSELADAKDPVELFYRGHIAEKLIEEIKDSGGIITAEDFSGYKVKWSSPTVAEIDRLTILSAPAPGSGALLTFILNVLKDIVPAKNDNIMWQRIMETFKWAYAKRTRLADPDFVDIDNLVAKLMSPIYAEYIRDLILKNGKTHNDPKYYGTVTANKEDAGTAHVSVLAPDGSAVSVTSSINRPFGAQMRSPSTGIIFNDQMDDFSLPGIVSLFGFPLSPNNLIEPYKRPFSSMTPTIAVDKNGKVALVIGAAGGVKITTAVASIMALYLWDDYDLKEAIDARRLHHQIIPMKVQNELGFPQGILDHLDKVGHDYSTYPGVGATVAAIAVKDGLISANADYRRQGKTAGF